jgi:hypothetical protein
MASRNNPKLDRRTLLKTSAAAVGAAVLGQVPRVASAHDLRPTDPAYRFDDYERIVNRDVLVRQVYQWPNISNPIVWANIRNGMNGFQFSYGIAPDDMQVVVQAYATANAAMYDDHIWEKYRFGEARGVTDPTTDAPATRNVFYPSSVQAGQSAPAERSHPYYGDTSIEGLQRRGVLFLI